MFNFLSNQKILQEVCSQSDLMWGCGLQSGWEVNYTSLLPDSDVISDGMQELLVRLYSSHMMHAPDC